MFVRPHVVLLACSLPLLGACADWPLHDNLPEPTDGVDAGDDLEDLLDIAWTEIAEDDATNGTPFGPTPIPLVRLAGVDLSGALAGVGWSSTAIPHVWSDPGCGPGEGTHSVTGEGDYAGDLDWLVLIVDAESAGLTLCADVRRPDKNLGFDVLLFALDTCSVPVYHLSDADDHALGYNGGGESVGWAAALPPGQYGLLMAGYSGPDPVAEYPYRLALSMVGSNPDGSPGLCPNAPGAP